MAEISINEYVRVKDGGIGKVIELFGETGIETDNENITKGWDGEGISNTYIQEIAKHSKNIIDLIEVGDYVNGKEICLIDKEENAVIWGFQLKDEQRIFYLYEKDIKYIVTKEQFENIKYIVEYK